MQHLSSSGFTENRKDSVITLHYTYSSSSSLSGGRTRGPKTDPVFVAEDQPLRRRVFIDRSVVEIFVNERQCVAQRVYPRGKTVAAWRCAYRAPTPCSSRSMPGRCVASTE